MASNSKPKFPGRDNAIELAMFECNLPLPPETDNGVPTVTVTLHTTVGDITLGANKILVPPLTKAKVKPWVAEEIVYERLGLPLPESLEMEKRRFQEG